MVSLPMIAAGDSDSDDYHGFDDSGSDEEEDDDGEGKEQE